MIRERKEICECWVVRDTAYFLETDMKFCDCSIYPGSSQRFLGTFQANMQTAVFSYDGMHTYRGYLKLKDMHILSPE